MTRRKPLKAGSGKKLSSKRRAGVEITSAKSAKSGATIERTQRSSAKTAVAAVVRSELKTSQVGSGKFQPGSVQHLRSAVNKFAKGAGEAPDRLLDELVETHAATLHGLAKR
jgi:hypothetical protein